MIITETEVWILVSGPHVLPYLRCVSFSDKSNAIFELMRISDSEENFRESEARLPRGIIISPALVSFVQGPSSSK